MTLDLRMTPSGLIVVTMLAFCGMVGCSGDKIDRLNISGTVNQAGGPANGIVRFVPKESGPAATAEIKNGKFAFTHENGPIAGEYDVIVETTVHDKRSFLVTSRSKTKAEGESKSAEWKFSLTVSAEKLELEPLVLDEQSAATPAQE